MALPSQAPRSIRVTNARPVGRGYRPRAVKRRRVAVFVLLVVGAAVVLGLSQMFKGLTGPQPAVAGQGTEGQTNTTVEAPVRDPLVASSSATPITRNVPVTTSSTPETVREDVQGRSNTRPSTTLTMGEPVNRPSTTTNQPANTRNTTSNPSTAPATNQGTRPSGASGLSGNTDVTRLIAAGAELITTDPVAARDILNRAMHHSRASEPEKLEARRALVRLNNEIFFGSRVVPGDPLTSTYVVKRGDTLGAIVSRENLATDWRLLLRLNGISDARKIREGQTLKVVLGPFHAVVDKSDYRLDIYSERYDEDGNRLFVTSYDIGLGEYGSTPIGSWIVRKNSKLLNPAWTNPRTGEQFGKDDPMNPIGEAWMGLDGTDENTRQFDGYGIHGTIDVDSIGKDMSMGCIRLLPGQIEQVWELLVEGVSTVQIVL